MEPAQKTIEANGLEMAYLELGSGPLAVCLHGFPDAAPTWRYLMPALADAGFRAIAPWLRGYAPTAVPADGHYQNGALVRDMSALHDGLDGDGDAVIVGHDWGARAANGSAAFAPQRWRRLVTAAVPPAGSVGQGFLTYRQLRRSWYMFFFQNPLADAIVGMNDFAFIRGLWADWSPGYDATADLPHVKAALAGEANLAAALGYYRATFQPDLQVPELAAEQAAVDATPPQPHLYIHGRDDGCMGIEVAETVPQYLTVPSSRLEVIDHAGHFMHLEQPDIFNRLVVEFLTAA